MWVWKSGLLIDWNVQAVVRGVYEWVNVHIKWTAFYFDCIVSFLFTYILGEACGSQSQKCLLNYLQRFYVLKQSYVAGLQQFPGLCIICLVCNESIGHRKAPHQMTEKVRLVVSTKFSLPLFWLLELYIGPLPKFLWVLARPELAHWPALPSLRAALACLCWLLRCVS